MEEKFSFAILICESSDISQEESDDYTALTKLSG